MLACSGGGMETVRGTVDLDVSSRISLNEKAETLDGNHFAVACSHVGLKGSPRFMA